MADVAIIGVGQSNFSRSCNMSIKELCFEGFKEAMEGLDITNSDIDTSIICSSPEYDKQRSPSALISEYLELTPSATFIIENACTSSSTGLRVAWSLIKSGLYKVIAVVGFQKMSELTSRESAEKMGRAYDVIWESPFGLTMPAGYAMYARAHMATYGTTKEQLAKVRVKNSYYSVKNPKATYQKALSLEEILESVVVASPLKMLDCCANADGSSCIIVANRDIAKRITNIPIWVIGLGAASDTGISGRESFTSFSSAKRAAKQAYAMAGIRHPAREIDLAEVYDNYAFNELQYCEALGLCGEGEGGRFIDEGISEIGGSIPVNPSGGLLGQGNPLGTAGLMRVAQAALQLRGEAGDCQIAGAEMAVAQGCGLPYRSGGVVVLSKW